VDTLDNDILGFYEGYFYLNHHAVKYHTYNLYVDGTNMKLHPPTLPMLLSNLRK